MSKAFFDCRDYEEIAFDDSVTPLIRGSHSCCMILSAAVRDSLALVCQTAQEYADSAPGKCVVCVKAILGSVHYGRSALNESLYDVIVVVRKSVGHCL